jgi:flavin reductase (DIM6/NTAB) family NADH-FMN oxidoreductase RutF
MGDCTLASLTCHRVDEELRGAFREAMSRHAAGTVVVSTRDRAGFRGLTATSFTGVSLVPPIVLVCLDSLAQTRDAVAEAGLFNVSVLERRQEFIAERFAGRAPLVDPTWRAVPHRLGANRLPIIAGAIAWLECRLLDLRPLGDHDVAFGEVTGAGSDSGEPLVLWQRSFWTIG